MADASRDASFKGMPLGGIATGIFGGILKPYVGYFDALKANLKRGGMKVSIEEYLSAITLYSLFTFILSIIMFSMYVSYFIAFVAAADIFYSYTLAVILSFVISGLTFMVGYYYPSIKAKGQQTKIERTLPFAVFYMSTSASSGIEPIEIFKMLSAKGGVIGAEANKIYNDVKALGMSLPDALQKAAMRSPSVLFADLLWGMTSIITTGGDLRKYLSGKTRSFMSQYRRSLDSYAKQIALYTEIYITLVIVGSLFFIVLLAIISPLTGGNTLVLQTILVFAFVPLVSLAFIMLLKSISPME